MFLQKFLAKLKMNFKRIFFLTFSQKNIQDNFSKKYFENKIFSSKVKKFCEYTPRGRIFSCVRPFFESAVSDLDP